MFEVIEFDDGEYGIRNTYTGKILSNYGEVLSFTTYERAEKRAKKIAKKFNRAVRNAKKKGQI